MSLTDADVKSEFEAGKIININKPAGMTSFAVVRKIRHWTQCKKVGHAGTLDPAATGVLLVCTGKATKQVSQFVDMDKEYEGKIHLGIATDSDDADGTVIEEKEVPELNEAQIEEVLYKFKGRIEQVPPMFSALKHNGKRLYKLARKGKVVERKPREVMIYDIELLSWESPFIQLRVHCLKGTYIRSLARDIGLALQTVAHLTTLQRTRIGDYKVQDAVTLEKFYTSLGTA